MSTYHVVSISGGKGSWFTGVRVAETCMEPGDHLVLLFADTKMEDEDLYRFLAETVRDVLRRLPSGCTGEFVELADGRDVWQVFFDSRFMGNSRIDPCSRILKRQLIRGWIDENCVPGETVIYLGIDWTEAHRFEKAEKHWAPFKCRAPLTEPPYFDRSQVDEELARAGIKQARLYDLGMAHNNCGGFCVKAGQASFRLLLEKLPERYAYHEAKEREFREFIGKDVAILTDRRGGGKRPMTLKEFRERIEETGRAAKPFTDDPVAMEDFNYEFGGCACFTPDDYAEESKTKTIDLGVPSVRVQAPPA